MVRWLLILILYCFTHAVVAGDKSILVLGDSLSDGYGFSIKHGWVALLQERLASRGYEHHVFNASISGDTTGGAYARLDGHIEDSQPEIAIIELGGNDGLRGLPLEDMYRNLSGIITRLLELDIHVLLIPIQIPPNYGQLYTTKFSEVYQRLAESHGVMTSKFLLDGIALDPELMQDDGIHPTAEAQMMILDNLWPYIKQLLDEQDRNPES